MTRPIVLIAAVGRNGAIGQRNAMPWRLAGDLRHFRDETMGCPVIMGRRTWQSIGRPLPGRSLLVVSGDPGLALPADTLLCRDPDEALLRARDIAEAQDASAVMVAGGGAIYAQLIDRADRLAITEVDLAPPADTFFPAIDPGIWRERFRGPRTWGPDDDAAYAFVSYERR